MRRALCLGLDVCFVYRKLPNFFAEALFEADIFVLEQFFGSSSMLSSGGFYDVGPVSYKDFDLHAKGRRFFFLTGSTSPDPSPLSSQRCSVRDAICSSATRKGNSRPPD